MLSVDREFHFIGDLNIKKSKILKSNITPKDDEANWMFIELDENNRSSFVYKIEEPQSARYNIPFEVKLAITFYDLVKDKLQLNRCYSVMRGEERIGTINLKEFIR